MSSTLEPGKPWRNWGRSESSLPAFIARPTSIEDVRAVVSQARERGLTVKPIGAGHSFTSIGATEGIRLDLEGLGGVVRVEGNRITLRGGTHLYQLPTLFAPHRLGLANMGDIDRQTITGATSTGTHGTGLAFGGLATQIRGVTLVTGDAEVLTLNGTENSELLPAAVLGLGALGVVVDVTIECVPEFLLHAVERPEPVDAVLESWAQRVEDADHFEFYWFPHSDVALTKTNTRLRGDAPKHPLGAFREWFDDSLMANTAFSGTVSIGKAFPKTIPAINRFSAKLTGNREFTDSSPSVYTTKRTVRFREMEYAIPLEDVPDALREIRALIDSRGWNISFPIEVRASAADDLMLSTASGRTTGYIAVHKYYKEDPEEYFRAVEQIMMAHGGRPHWGKMHYRDRSNLETAYPRFGEFLAVRDRLDPERVFTNAYLDRVLGA